jgi:hypothetical protein
MTLADLSSARAVEQAVEEFDRLGRDAFLAKYGFGRAREYFLELNGKRYDSKAIVGAAHGVQFPSAGPLRAADFSGGEATVQAKLEELGFTVLASAPSTDDTAPGHELLSKEFHQRMIDIYKAAKAEARYNASRFLAMVNEHGGLEAAQILLRAPAVSEGYTALWDRQRLDLTVEAVILEKKWWPLFTDAERRAAVRRLRDYQYSGHLPDL